MGLSSSKPFQIFLSDIFEKVRCEFEESSDKESERYSGEDFNITD